MSKKVYMCGPITSLSIEEARSRRSELSIGLSEKISIIDPLRGIVTGHEFTHESVLKRDRSDVMSSDLVLADLRGVNIVSIGSMIEFGWADALRIPIITIMEDSGNPHEHFWVRELSTYVVNNTSEACYLANLLLAL